jgi:hypothetical protein
MSEIGLDILNIGSAKWGSTQYDGDIRDPDFFSPSQFMLPAVKNVTMCCIYPIFSS